ncbi:MAG TPA: tetratricopeptide repeat protein [bacterium]
MSADHAALAATRGRRRLIAAVLVAVTLALYAQVAGHDFITLDDGAYITLNPNVSTGLTLENVRWALTAEHSGNWHPLTWISHMLDVQLFGLDAGRHHFVSALLHAVDAALLFAATSAMTGAVWPSALVAALFAWHPLHVESVAWAAERKDVLSTLFWMLALLAYVRYARRPSPRRYAGVVAALALGLASKPMLVTLPFVLLLLDYWPLARLRAGWRLPLLDKLPLLALAAASSALTVHAQRESNAVLELVYSPLRDRAANALLSATLYLRDTFWPARLTLFYPHPHGSWEAWKIGVGAALLAAVTLAALALARRAPALFTGWFWYAGTLVPVIGLVQVGDQARADRYTYVPLVGIFIVLAAGLRVPAARARRAVAAAVAVALIALAAACWRQIGYWQSGLTVYQHGIDTVPDNWLAYLNISRELSNAGRQKERSEAMSKAFALNPQLKADTYCNAAGILIAQGDLARGIEQLRSALRVAPGHREAMRRLRELLRQRPEAYLLVGPEAAGGNRDAPAARYVSAGNELGRLQLFEESVAAFKAAIRLRPDLAEAYAGLGTSLGNLRRFPEAEAAYREALRLKPGLPEAQGNLATLLKAMGR